MLEREFGFNPCCLIRGRSKEVEDPESVYDKCAAYSTEKKPEILHVQYVIDQKPETVSVPGESVSGKEKVSEEKKEEEDTGFQKPKKGWRRYIGILLILLATMTYSIGTLIIKILQDFGHHPFTVSYIRFQGLLFPAASIMVYFRFFEKKKVFTPIYPLTNAGKLKTGVLLMIRSIVGCTSTICHIFALQYINLADASVIAFSCPVFVIVIAHLIGMEKMGYTSFLVTILTLTGVGIICRPPMLTGSSDFDTNMLIGCGLAFASMLCTSTVILILRSLRGLHFSLLMTSYGLFGTMECAIFALFSGVLVLPTEVSHWILCFGLISFTFIAQISLIASLKYEEAGPVALIQTTDSIFSFLWQYLAFSVLPDIYSLSGAAIVIFSVGIISFKKIISSLPEGHKGRQYFHFILK